MCYTPVPSGSPRNLRGVSLHPDNIELRWDPPQPDELNGNIAAYYINVTHIGSGESHSFQVGNTQFFSGGGFHPYYTYVCTVFAVTVGPGPGNSINVTTREAGEALHVCIYICDSQKWFDGYDVN